MLPQLCLSPQERESAWQRHFAYRLEDLPDRELAWERSVWTRAGSLDLARLCDREASDRRSLRQTVPGGASIVQLDRLARAVSLDVVAQIVEREALPAIEAIRLAFWCGLRSERAA